MAKQCYNAWGYRLGMSGSKNGIGYDRRRRANKKKVLRLARAVERYFDYVVVDDLGRGTI